MECIRIFKTMRYAKIQACFGLATLLVTVCWADAKLVNFDIPVAQRGVGHYSVVFKSERELRLLPALYRDPKSGVRRSKILPNVLPISQKDTEALAKALAASIGGRAPLFSTSIGDKAPAIFDLEGVTDEAAKSLAKDPRIDVIAVSVATADPGVNRRP